MRDMQMEGTWGPCKDSYSCRLLNILASCCSKNRLESNPVTAILFIGCSDSFMCEKSHDTERRRSTHHLPVLLPRRPRHTSRTSQTAMTGPQGVRVPSKRWALRERVQKYNH
jgi:hypothetical protein